MGLWLSETPQVFKCRHELCYFLIAQQYLFLFLQSLLSERTHQLPNPNTWVLPSPEFVVLSVSEVFVPSLSLSKPYSSRLPPAPERAQPPHHHPTGRTACVTLFTKGFAQLGCWYVLSYFPGLSNSWQSNICILPGILVSPLCHQCHLPRACNKCAQRYPMAQL